MLKLFTYSALLIFLASFVNAQIIFQEDFDGINGPTAGGAGTYTFPSGWLLRNVDNRTPDAQVAYVNEAWERREDFSMNVIDSAAFSTSYYSPLGSSDDWMWTPPITLPATGNHILKWKAVAYDPAFRDGYEVRIMVSPNTPTGGTGAIGNQVTNSTQLFSTPAENSSWTDRDVNLNDYNGTTFRIAFRNNSNDKFLLLIDDIVVEQVTDFDLVLTEYTPFEYTKIPLSQAKDIPLKAKVRNMGILPAQNFNLKASIRNSNNELVETIYSANIVSLASGQTTEPVFPAWNPADTDEYTVTYETNSSETDPTPENNSLVTSMEITSNVYARDNGDVVGSLGIGAGNGGYLGQSFTIHEETTTSSGTITYVRGYAGKNYKLALWNTDGSGEPSTIIAETELKTYLNDDGFTDTLDFSNGPVNLSPGKYVLTAVEIDSTVAVAQTSFQFTPGTTFVDWPTSPIAGWGNNEDFGQSFQKTYAIRLNLKRGIEPDANNILYVDKNVAGGEETGNSWENAIPELADALKWAKQNETDWTEDNPLQIWVADGTYTPLYSPADNNFGNPDGRQNSFLLVKNVQLYGGFNGGESNLNERNWGANPALLSGEIQDDNTHDNNAYHVTVAAGDIGSAVIDGFTIENGHALEGDQGENQFTTNGLSFQNRASGGIISRDANLIISNCTFYNNQGYSGSALHNTGGTSIVDNTLFYENSAPDDLYSNVIYSQLSATLTNVTMTENSGSSLVNGTLIYVNNSILWGNNILQTIVNANVQNSIIQDFEETSENLDTDPLFTDPDNNDFKLQACSPAVNSGDNSLFTNLNDNTLDLAGNPRVYDFDNGGIIDIGAYEFQGEQADYSQVAFEDLTVTYDGEEKSIEVENIPNGISVSYEITNENNQTTSGNSATDAGVYQIKATLSGCGEPQEYTATLTIEKAEAIITADATQTYTYDGNMHIVSASLNHVETALVYTPQQGYTNAGTYEITVSAEETDNYLEASEEVTLVIENSEWDQGGGSGVSLPDETYTYNGTAQSIEVENLPNDATVTYTITDSDNNTENGNSATDAGIYTIIAELTRPNYNDLELSATLTINKAEAVIASDNTQTHTYDGTLKNVVASLNHNETNLVYSPQQGYTDAGTYEIEVSSVETTNYLAASKDVTLVINNADFEGITFDDDEFTYDGTAHSIFVSGEPDGATVTYTNNGQTNAGTYTVTALIKMDNYDDLELTAELTINKAEAVITADDIQTHTYDGSVKNVVASLNHHETSLIYSPQQGYTDAGTYEIEVSSVETTNYLAVSKDVTLIINNADFEGITFDDDEFTYNGTAHSIFVSGEPAEATVTYTGNGQTNAGNYTVTALIQMDNYDDLELTAELTINKAEAVITSDDTQTHTYDGTVKNVVASLNHNETNLVYSPQQGYTEAGTYEIEVSAVETTNYLAVSKDVTLIINNADFEGITFDDDEFTYNGTAHSIFVSGEPAEATVTYTGNGQTNAGTYTVTALIQMDNYNDLELTAELTINKAEAVITADDIQTHTYDGTVKNVVASLNHNETNLVYSPQQGYTDAGTYEIEVSAVETQNYLAISKDVTLVINNADFEGITFDDDTFTYDGTTHSIFVSGAPSEAEVTYTNNGQTNAGTYTVTVLVQMDNYDDLELTAELTINKANQVITFNPIPVKNLETDADFQLGASSNSGLNVYYTYTFEGTSPPATVTPEGWVDLFTSGSVMITAHQDGNENYNPAASVTRELVIESSDNSIHWISFNGEVYENPGSEIYYLIDCDNSTNSVNIQIEAETGATVEPGNNFTIETPTPGIYYQTITVTSDDGSVNTYEIIIEKRFNFNDIVIQKFDNVLLVNNNPETNGGYEFTAYEWFRNGELIGTGQYYSAGDDASDTLDPNAVYFVRMKTSDGEWLSTCESGITLKSSYSVKIAPNPVYSGNVIKVIADFPEDELKNMKIRLYSMAGELIMETSSSQRITEIQLPMGVTSASYVVQVDTGKNIKNIQFLVK